MTREAASLRRYLATPPAKAEGLRESGWHLIGNDGEVAEFLTTGEDGGEVIVQAASVEDGWRVSIDPRCRPELVLGGGVGPGSWELDPDGPKPEPQTRAFRLLVQERTCSSGQPPLGRIVGPVVLPAHDRIYVVFGVRPVGGTCQRSPPSAVEIDLGEAIGERVLVDPVTWPHVVIDIG